MLLAVGSTAVLADDHEQHYRAYDALEAGTILPLTEILQKVSGVASGTPIEVELERDDGIWIYELEIRGSDGRLIELEVDATSGVILALEKDDD